MRIFLFLSLIILLSNCTTVEVAKEVTKATESIKTSVQKITKKENKYEEDNKKNEMKIQIAKEKEIIKKEQKKEKQIVKKQKQIIQINFMGKTMNEIYMRLGDSSLFRLDGNTQTMRYDAKSCRLFLFFNATVGIPRVEYYEFRDTKGKVLSSKEKISFCYKDFGLS